NLIESGQTITSGATLNLTGATGGTTHISSGTVALSEAINAVNDAPVLDATKTPVLGGVNTSIVAPTGAVGTLVSALVDFATPAGQVDNVTDSDTGVLLGIALTGTATGGTWYYSTNNGGAWATIGTVNDASALLLAADANTRVFYQSTTGGTVTNAITFRAWDQSSGTAGAKVTTATNGGTTAFSAATDTANVTVTAADTTPPTVTVTSTTLGGGAATVTFQFSESVTGFDLSPSDVTVTRATFSNFVQVDGDTYTATLTRNTSGAVKVDVLAGSYTDLAGNAGTAGTSGTLGTLPAGVAGEPIHLALLDPSSDPGQMISVTVGGVPSDWILNAGTSNGDGTWTVQTNDPSTLTVTTPVNYSGALVLEVNMTWTNADGSTGSAFVANNVEAYAPGNPIFALSADDHLTASSAADLLVFAQPIAQDVIHNFDAAADKIDLIGFTDVNAFENLSITDDANGNAVIATGGGSTITVVGVHAADLTAANFEFNLEPVTINTGTMTIANGAILPLGGVIENSGTIALGSTGSETDLQILVESVTLQGGGQVVLSDDDNNVIFGGAANATLINLDNTISGAGQIGAGQMTLVNASTIIANGNHALVIDTGSNVVDNSGTLEATGPGGLVVESELSNTGSMSANGGDITIHGDVTGHGSASINGHGAIEFSAASDANVGFASDASGTLTLDHAASFTGTLTGLNADDTLHFGDIAFSASTQVSYTANAAGMAGSLLVTDGTHTAQMTLVGQYSAADFQLAAGQSGSTAVINTAVDNATVLGTAGADALTGTSDNDIIVGGAGSDTLTGGAGSDTFMFRSSDAGAVDTITDFNAGAGGDMINIGLLLQGCSSGADLSQFISLRESGSDTIVSIDSDGAGSTHGFHDLLVMQGVTGLDFGTLIAHVDATPLP
ncbi:MAG: type I secretion C-terminal target domain-containing protein, partial [Burkholderiales bacterium]|nr:type I secretion C-terminal target domain-containing protein [Burkholderiales bacterium]